MPHAALGDEGEDDMLVVLPSYGCALPNPYLRQALRTASDRYLWMAGVDCSAWLLADADCWTPVARQSIMTNSTRSQSGSQMSAPSGHAG